MIGNNITCITLTTAYSEHRSKSDGGSVYTGFTFYVVYECVRHYIVA